EQRRGGAGGAPGERLGAAGAASVRHQRFWGSAPGPGPAPPNEAAPQRPHRGGQQRHGAAGGCFQRRLLRLQVRGGGAVREPGRAAAAVQRL
ncbi:hypothetical protein IHE44_0010976, partial [Lamprotornis superbus]